jgi:hypothetical protein
LLVAATFGLLLLAPASGSAGLRGSMLVIASAALLFGRGRRLLADLRAIPRAVLVTVAAWGALSTDLISPVPLDTLYKVETSNVTVNFSARGFRVPAAKSTIRLTRTGTPDDSVVVSMTGMVQR